MTTEINRPGTKVVWQNDYADVFEQPILIVPYNGSISIKQDKDNVLLAIEHVEEFIKALRAVKKNAEKE